MPVALIKDTVYRNKQGKTRKIIKITADSVLYLNERGEEKTCSLNAFTKWAWMIERSVLSQ